jgi:hypothetical protein
MVDIELPVEIGGAIELMLAADLAIPAAESLIASVA